MWSPTPAPAAVPIARARQLPPYSCVRLDDAVVTATNLSGSAFVESIDRTAGVRLLTNQSLAVGQRVGLRGIVTRQSGEYLVRNVVFHSTADGDPLAPLGMTTKTIGNDRTETLSYIGQNTTGLLVRVAGKVTGVVSAQRVIYLDDGYNYQDGMLPGLGIFGIRVYIPEGLTLPTKGKRLVVTGISRVEQFTLTQWSEVNGMVWGPGTVLYVPSIWPRDAADIRLLN